MLCTVMLAGMSGTPLARGPSGWCVCMTAKPLLQETHALHAAIRHKFRVCPRVHSGIMAWSLVSGQKLQGTDQ